MQFAAHWATRWITERDRGAATHFPLLATAVSCGHLEVQKLERFRSLPRVGSHATGCTPVHAISPLYGIFLKIRSSTLLWGLAQPILRPLRQGATPC